MKQMTFGAGTFEPYRKRTRREHFLAEMDRVVPWAALCALIKPFYPKAGHGRCPLPLERMLRIYFVQQVGSGRGRGAQRFGFAGPFCGH